MKQVERKKTAHLHVDMDEELYSKLMQKAESYGVGLSNYARVILRLSLQGHLSFSK